MTLENDVFALDEETGATVWTRNVGPPAGPGAGPGVVSRGIMGTPVIDEVARVLYLVAGIGPGTLIRHEIHAISVDTGLEVPGNWPIDVSKVRSGSFTFNPARQHQRSALSLVKGRLYVAFGGNGDSPGYRGWVVIVNTRAPSDVAVWTSLGAYEGIWNPGGMASDGNGVFAITGNGTSTSDDHADTDAESVLRIQANGVSLRDATNQFVPSEWKSMDAGDLDFGSCSPLLLRMPGSSPETLLIAPSKPGHLYLLNPTRLGGIGGQLSDLLVGNPTSESVYAVPTTYQTSQGVYVALNVSSGARCPAEISNHNLLGVLLKPGSPPVPQVAWCAKLTDDNEVGRRSPISTTTDGRSNAIVWFMNGSSLNAFEGDSGTPLFAETGPGCSGVHRFTSPIAANGRIIVGGDGHLCSWSVH
ncbi:MAG TPA: hypothetical protein VGC79_21815 [Polyangiaceae bacterium]